MKERKLKCKGEHTANGIEHAGLAFGLLVLGRRVANVVTGLGTTESGSDGVYLVRLMSEKVRD